MQWQLEQTPRALVLRLVRGESSVAPEGIVADLERALEVAGAVPPPIDVQLVDAVARTPLGKAPLIKAFRER